MSFHILLGAFPVRQGDDSLDPVPNARVGELRGSSRGGAFVQSFRALLEALPGHEALRFLANEAGPFSRQRTDPQTRWTVLDETALPIVITALDDLLAACSESAGAIAARVVFGTERLGIDEIRQALAAARDSADLNAAAHGDDDGESAEFFFAVLVSLRNLLRRAQAESTPVAVFLWAPE